LLILLPNPWDRVQLGNAKYRGVYDFDFKGTDLFHFPESLKLVSFSSMRFLDDVDSDASPDDPTIIHGHFLDVRPRLAGWSRAEGKSVPSAGCGSPRRALVHRRTAPRRDGEGRIRAPAAVVR
jgi:hypothetical protein